MSIDHELLQVFFGHLEKAASHGDTASDVADVTGLGMLATPYVAKKMGKPFAEAAAHNIELAGLGALALPALARLGSKVTGIKQKQQKMAEAVKEAINLGSLAKPLTRPLLPPVAEGVKSIGEVATKSPIGGTLQFGTSPMRKRLMGAGVPVKTGSAVVGMR
jgi:hypothetical protein